MLEFFKKLFSATPTETPAPYKVEAPVPENFNLSVKAPAKTAKPKVEKKPTVKKATTRKPKAPKV